MKKNNYILIVFVAFLGGCFDMPKDVVAPSWDANLKLPLTNYSYTLLDAIKDDSALIYSKNPENYGLIYYNKTDSLEEIKLGREVSVDQFSFTTSKQIGEIKINDIPPIVIELKVEDWTDNVKSGMYQDFPENTSVVLSPFSGTDQFKEVTLNDGYMDIIIKNNLPVDLELRGMLIRNAITKSTIIERYVDNIVYVNANDEVNLPFNIAGKTITDSLEYYGIFHTDGSNGVLCQIPYKAGTEIKATLRNLSIESALAPIPEQDPIILSDAVEFDDSNKILNAVIDEGSFNVSIRNDFSTEINVQLIVNQLINSYGQQYSVSRNIPAKSNVVISESSLKNWQLKFNSLSNSVNYTANARILNSNGRDVRINISDNVTINGNFSRIVLGSIEGQIKPTRIVFPEKRIHSDFDELNKKNDFSQLNFSNNSDIYINLISEADVDMIFNGNLVISNGNTSQNKSINLSNILINTNNPTKISLKDYGLLNILNSFSGDVPTDFILTGNALVNPYYRSDIVIPNKNLISPSITYDIPFEFNISGGNITDTLDIDINSKDDIDKLKSIELVLELKNTIPAEVSFYSEVIGPYGNVMFSIPLNSSESNRITVPAPTYSSGNVNPGTSRQSIILTEQNADDFISSSKMVVHFQFQTKGATAEELAKFKISDFIQLKMSGNLTYRVNEND